MEIGRLGKTKEKRFLALLRMFPGGATSAALEALLGAGWREGLETAIRRHVVRKTGEDEEDFYSLAEGSAMSVEEGLPSAELEGLRREVCRWWQSQCDALLHLVAREGIDACEKELGKVEANLLACLKPERKAGFKSEGKAASAAARLGVSLARVFLFLGRIGDSKAVLDRVLAASEHSGDRSGRALAMEEMGELHARRGDLVLAAERFSDALAYFFGEGSAVDEARLLAAIARVKGRRGDFEGALRDYQDAEEKATDAGDGVVAARISRAMGDLCFRMGCHENARIHFRHALARLQEQEELLVEEASCLLSVAALESREGNRSAARAAYQEAYDLYGELRHSLGQAHALRGLGAAEMASGRHAHARRNLEEALSLYQQGSGSIGMANCLQSLARLRSKEGEREEAWQLLIRAFDIHVSVGDGIGVGSDLGYLAHLARERGQVGRAFWLAEMALACHRLVGDRLGQAMDLRLQGDLFQREGVVAGSLAAWWLALGLFKLLGTPDAAKFEAIFARLEKDGRGTPYELLFQEILKDAEAVRMRAISPFSQKLSQDRELLSMAGKIGFASNSHLRQPFSEKA